MKYKKLLLIVFLLTLFVVQQAQAGTVIPSSENPAPANTSLLSEITIYLYPLIDTTGEFASQDLCKWPEDVGKYGCGDMNPNGDEYSNNTEMINPENFYLDDVLATEMNLAQIPPEPEALKAQAVASRSIATWKAKYNPWVGVNSLNNSRDYQVLNPGARKIGGYQSVIDDAVNGTSGQFLQYWIEGRNVIDAEFGADMDGATNDGDLVSAPYLKGISDPISSTPDCILHLGTSGAGMSQRGAIRWAKGNTCPDGTGTLWPIKWDYKQILAHYYTGVEFKNDDTGTSFAPDDRWNLISHTFPLDVNRMGNANAGEPRQFDITLQNTSTQNWADNNTEIYYQWTAKGAAATGQWIKFDGFSVPATNKGDPLASVTGLPITMPASGGDYTLHLDLYRNGHWFSQQSPAWPDATIDVHVDGPTATPTFTPTVPTETPTPTLPPSTPTITPTPTLITGVLTCGTTANGVTCTNKGSYLDYDINFKVKGLTGGTTVYSIFIGTYKRSTTGGYMGMTSNFVHAETSSDARNTVLSLVRIKPFDSGNVDYPSFTGGPGIKVPVMNQVSDWRYIAGTGGQWNTLSVRGNVDYAITGYSIKGHIYLYSNQGFDEPNGCFHESSNQMSSVSQFVLNSLDRIFNQRVLLYDVRDEILKTALGGQRYIDLYYAHSAEIATILNDHDQLAGQGLDVIDALTPNLQALLYGQGDTVMITSTQVQQTQAFLDALLPYASPELQQSIANERALHPLEIMIGMTMNQAMNYIFDTVAPTVVSIVRSSESPTSAESVDFAVAFSEEVTGVDENDFNLAIGGGVNGASITSVSGAGSTYTVTVSTGSGNGSIGLNVNESGTGIEDLAGNPLEGGFTSEPYTIDKSAEVQVYVHGDLKGQYEINPSDSISASYAGTNNGPARITSSSNIITTERVIWGTGYDELIGYPANQLTNEYFFPWYNNVAYNNIAMSSQLRIANTGDVSAQVDVYIGGAKITATPYTISPENSVRVEYAGINDGPVRVVTNTSGATILATMRVTWGTTGYDDLIGYPANQLTNEYLFPWYNNNAMISEFSIAVP